MADTLREDDLMSLISGVYILELKFDMHIPKWTGRLVNEFHLRQG